jgi:hypothetical protein
MQFVQYKALTTVLRGALRGVVQNGSHGRKLGFAHGFFFAEGKAAGRGWNVPGE